MQLLQVSNRVLELASCKELGIEQNQKLLQDQEDFLPLTAKM